MGGSRIGLIDIQCDVKASQRPDQMRHIDRDIRQQAHAAEVGGEVQNYVQAVPQEQGPEVNSASLGGNESGNQR